MPEYKRKKVKKKFLNKKKSRNTSENIIMTDKKTKKVGVVPEDDIKVVRGAKYKKRRRTKIFVSAISFIILVCIILSAVLPGGLYENIINLTSIMGQGGYPTRISGGTVINTVSNGLYYYVLTDTNITAYSSGGKIIFDELHGFSNPVLSVSDTRVLVYDQGGRSLYIYNLNGKIHTLQSENDIITASISKNGDFAVATLSDSYASVVTAYNNRFKEIYTWNSAKEIINNVLINPAGNRIAVSTFDVVSGQYVSKLSVLDFKSADPLHTLDLGDSPALSITNSGGGISIVCNSKFKFLHWSKFNSNELSFSGEINYFRNSNNGILLTVNRANDRSDNTIVLVSKKGEKVSEFKINNSITDIQYYKGRVYSVCDTAVNIYDKSGNILKKGDCNYGTQKFAVLGSNSIAAVSDLEIEKINIQEGES